MREEAFKHQGKNNISRIWKKAPFFMVFSYPNITHPCSSKKYFTSQLIRDQESLIGEKI